LDPNFFTDEKVGRLSMPERQLFAAMIANQDDDGRLKGHPAYLRSIAFPYDELTTDEVCQMRDHIAEVNPNVIAYQNAGEDYIQLKRHKRYQKPRYYHPSKLPPPPGWPFEEDEGSDQMVTKQSPSGDQMVTKQHTEDRVGLGKGLDLDKDKGRRIGRGGERLPPPSPTDLCTDIHKILDKLLESFRIEFGRVPAENPDTIIPSEPNARERAQIRDLAAELVRAGGCPLSYIREAFREAAGQQTKTKMSVSYVRAILLDWLGVKRNRSP
jgi:hypothetical protein